jgi:cysteine protease ATG4
VQSLARTFALSQSVGILGGRPRGARWFFGSYADGSKIFGLDPHTVQPAINSSLTRIAQEKLPSDYLESLHTEYPDTIDLIRMDPSIALGFYCRNRKELQDLEQSLERIVSNDVGGGGQPLLCPPLVTFMDQAPNYEEGADAVAMMNGMLLHDEDEEAILGGGGKKSDNSGDDDDDYVLL